MIEIIEYIAVIGIILAIATGIIYFIFGDYVCLLLRANVDKIAWRIVLIMTAISLIAFFIVGFTR